MDTEQVVHCLRQWEQETGATLPLPAYDMAYRERAGVIFDLDTGHAFQPRAHWLDFAIRWKAEIERRGETPTVERLTRAIQRANEHNYDLQLCAAIASATLATLTAPPDHYKNESQAEIAA